MSAGASAQTPEPGRNTPQAQKDTPKKGGGRAILADRRFAAGVLASIILVFTPLGARMSLQRAVDRVEEQFYTGVEPYGAVAGYLEDASEAALGLISLGTQYDAVSGQVGGLRADRTLLLDALESGDISELSHANGLVVQSFDSLKNALLSLELSEQDAGNMDDYVSRFEGAEGAIGHSGYDRAVEDFTENTYDRFPASLIGSALGVEPPEPFQEGTS